MGTNTYYRGVLEFEPPLSWGEIQQTEAWEGHPDHFPESFHHVRYGTRLIVDEDPVEAPEGTLIRRLASAVEIVGDELRHDGVMSQLRTLARQHGATHRITGTLECRHDHPDVETGFRVRIVGTEVEEIWPVLFWPDDPDVLSRIKLPLQHRASIPSGDVNNIAARVLGTLAANYAQKG